MLNSRCLISSSLATNVQTVNNGGQVPTSEGVKKPPNPLGKPRDQPKSTSQTQETQENEQTLDPFVVGNFDSRFPNTAKMIRLYISSNSTGIFTPTFILFIIKKYLIVSLFFITRQFC